MIEKNEVLSELKKLLVELMDENPALRGRLLNDVRAELKSRLLQAVDDAFDHHTQERTADGDEIPEELRPWLS